VTPTARCEDYLYSDLDYLIETCASLPGLKIPKKHESTIYSAVISLDSQEQCLYTLSPKKQGLFKHMSQGGPGDTNPQTHDTEKEMSTWRVKPTVPYASFAIRIVALWSTEVETDRFP
jgi:hypothetical protein